MGTTGMIVCGVLIVLLAGAYIAISMFQKKKKKQLEEELKKNGKTLDNEDLDDDED